jgi:hypothetical protein
VFAVVAIGDVQKIDNMKANIASLVVALVVGVASLVATTQASALPAGWTEGGCFGRDRIVFGPNGSYIIYHNSIRCQIP